MKKFPASSIKTRTISVLLLLVLVFLTTFLIAVFSLRHQQSNSLVINVAGRQRMLSQKISKECLIYLSPHAGLIKKETIENSVKLFQLSMDALLDGGMTYSDPAMTQAVILPSMKDPDSKAQCLQVRALWAPFRVLVEKILQAGNGSEADIKTVIQQNVEILTAMHKTVGLLQKSAESALRLPLYAQIVGVVLVMLTGLLMFNILMRTVIAPLKAMVSAVDHLAQGDLTVNVDAGGSDEVDRLRDGINGVVHSFRELIVRVKDASETVAYSSGEIASGSEDLAVRTNQEAASVTQTAATLEELSANVHNNSENSREAGGTLTAFNQEINQRSHLMQDVTATMEEIHQSGRKIDAIVNVINDISFQTNLLALNAAVEAARAGEAGRGFAVVAAEVRNLAQKTAESSKSIQEIVSSNVQSTTRGLELVTRTNDFFTTIVSLMSGMVQQIQSIADGSKEQASGIDQINTAVNQLDVVITQNAALVEELAATAKGMKSNSRQLLELVNRFKTNA